MQTPKEFMTYALSLAARGRLTVSPNPMVGCVIVKDGKIIGEGFHKRPGENHAEIHALKAAGSNAKGATVYVTLEPCCHHGKTPPCTDALIAAGIKTVYVATLDPNPLVNGKGIKILEAAGITVHVGVEKEAAIALNKVFFHFIQKKRPFVIAKWAMSLDGKTITHPLDSKSISNNFSQINAHEMRQTVDAILIGANTAREDNPQLTVRLPIPTIKQPLRIILSRDGNLPLDLKLFDDELRDKTLLVTTNAIPNEKRKALQAKNIEVLICPANLQNEVDLFTLLTLLGERNITSLLVEGGETLHAQFFANQLVNEVQVYLAPVIISSLNKKLPITLLTALPLGNDFCFQASCEVNSHV